MHPQLLQKISKQYIKHKTAVIQYVQEIFKTCKKLYVFYRKYMFMNVEFKTQNLNIKSFYSTTDLTFVFTIVLLLSIYLDLVPALE